MSKRWKMGERLDLVAIVISVASVILTIGFYVYDHLPKDDFTVLAVRASVSRPGTFVRVALRNAGNRSVLVSDLAFAFKSTKTTGEPCWERANSIVSAPPLDGAVAAQTEDDVARLTEHPGGFALIVEPGQTILKDVSANPNWRRSEDPNLSTIEATINKVTAAIAVVASDSSGRLYQSFLEYNSFHRRSPGSFDEAVRSLFGVRSHLTFQDAFVQTFPGSCGRITVNGPPPGHVR
jgi:hypothetical protein